VDPAGRPHAWRWDGESMTELVMAPGFVSAVACGINDAGQIVGYAETQDGWRGWIWQNGSMTALSTLAAGTIPFAINNSGTIVGYSIPPNGGFTRALRWVDGAVTDIGSLPGDQNSAASAISDDGRIVGSSYSDIGAHGALWQNGQIIDIASFGGGGFVDPRGVNANGQIVGRTVIGGAVHAVIWQGPPLQ
jgi:probable HAF family extracellular repeat protein